MKTGLHDELAKEVLVTSVSSLGSALTQYQSPISSLDKNGDGIISADELAAANVSSGASATTASAAKASSAGAGDSGSAADVVNRITADILSMMLQMQQQSESGTSSDDSSDAASRPQGILAALDTDGDGQLTTSEILSGDTQSLAGNAATQSCALPVSAFAANTPASPSPRAMHGRARHALRHRCGAMRETIVCRTAR